jgi:hypothetical protein
LLKIADRSLTLAVLKKMLVVSSVRNRAVTLADG